MAAAGATGRSPASASSKANSLRLPLPERRRERTAVDAPDDGFSADRRLREALIDGGRKQFEDMDCE